ncbi:MAG: hypothetical protein KAU21_04815 [Gammaproteobacteria bacterium]|nr:hypothetical protein [Gammaproteobacteria bacterium]
MTNEEITQTIQREIQQAQQPLLERIDDLEQRVDEALDWICALNVISGATMMHIPLASMQTVAKMIRDAYNQLPENQRQQKPAGNLLYWAVRFERLAQQFSDDSDKMDQLNG